jgi:MerR family transcriptional regulator, light-induced transcriptional regulator
MSKQFASDGRLENSESDDWTQGLKPIDELAPKLDDSKIMELLATVVEGEIIPRLMLVHKSFERDGVGVRSDADITEDAIEKFAQLTIDGEVDDLENYIVGLTRQGIAEEAIYMELMAPTARKLGSFWEQDLCSFTDVTVGLGRLQTILYRISARHRSTYEAQDVQLRGLFVTPAGAHHSFGIRMVEDLFRRAGWRSMCEPNIALQDLTELVKTEYFDLVGIGVSIQDQVEVCHKMIAEIRGSSLNRGVKIMVGGSLLADREELRQEFSAELCAVDAREAVAIAHSLVYDNKLRH